jgi:5-(carboxyamino)imidazole ribonucleotide mutase
MTHADEKRTEGSTPHDESSLASQSPVVGVIMGSESDYETMQVAEEVLRQCGVAFETHVVSAHRTPELMFEYAQGAATRGLRVIIAGAGGAAHLPGMVSALTTLPVLGVPIKSKGLKGLDSLLSIVQMPRGVPTATFAIGLPGAANAALFAVRLLALHDEGLREKLDNFVAGSKLEVLESNERVQSKRREPSS